MKKLCVMLAAALLLALLSGCAFTDKLAQLDLPEPPGRETPELPEVVVVPDAVVLRRLERVELLELETRFFVDEFPLVRCCLNDYLVRLRLIIEPLWEFNNRLTLYNADFPHLPARMPAYVIQPFSLYPQVCSCPRLK